MKEVQPASGGAGRVGSHEGVLGPVTAVPQGAGARTLVGRDVGDAIPADAGTSDAPGVGDVDDLVPHGVEEDLGPLQGRMLLLLALVAWPVAVVGPRELLR